MGKPYAEELSALAATLYWSARCDLGRLLEGLSASFGKPLVAVGSGGSLTACRHLVALHRRMARQPARIATPLGFLQEGINRDEAVWFVSAGGSNTDILKAFAACVAAEPRVVGTLCSDAQSPLARASEACSYCDLALFDLPTGKDGFLATNSLLAFCVLFTRAYESLIFDKAHEFTLSESLSQMVQKNAGRLAENLAFMEHLLTRDTLVVLHSSATEAAAYDVESRFTEAALGWAQVADYRNFAHGRHHWLAKNESDTAVLAFVSPEDRDLASNTLATLPASVPTLRIDLADNWRQAALEAIVASQYLAQWKGRIKGIDPGQPGVPAFGHHIYKLEYQCAHDLDIDRIDVSTRLILERKTRQRFENLVTIGVLREWLRDLDAYRKKLASSHFAAVVFDYDGTLVGPRKRTAPPEPDIVVELRRLLESGAIIGIATGRGVSVRDAVRNVLPQELWNQVYVGYYNGAEIIVLSDDSAPHRAGPMCQELAAITRELRRHRELGSLAQQTDRPHQITLEPKRTVPENLLWTLTNEVVVAMGIPGVRVVRSSHSADVLAPGVSKRNVVERIWDVAGRSLGEPLCIGDHGCWPGNDFELLAGVHSLSVDESNGSPDRCWNLALPGSRGTSATREYLLRLRCDGGGLIMSDV